MDINLLLTLVIAVVMALIVGFFDALVKQVQTGIYDKGYLVAMGIYSIVVGLIAGFSGLIDLSAGIAEWQTVLITVFGSYFVYLTMMHSVFDYIISKLFPSQPQGLATKFMAPEKVAALAPRK